MPGAETAVQRFSRRTIEKTVNFRPLGEFTAVPHRDKPVFADKAVMAAVDLAAAPRPGRAGDREFDIRVARAQPLVKVVLPAPDGAERIKIIPRRLAKRVIRYSEFVRGSFPRVPCPPRPTAQLRAGAP